jgi:beta-lactamase superfamily II metal-dependent hydrolase
VEYRTFKSASPVGVILSIGRGDRGIAVRSILLLIGALVLSLSAARAVKAEGHPPESAAQTSTTALEKQRTLPVWTEGHLYIHHISTGRGNASYFVMPDGTTMLIDAGEADPSFIARVAPLKKFPERPDAAHSAGYWVADYIHHFAPAGRPVGLDYALITHFHTDHFGTITPASPMSKVGPYRLAGITEVADLIPIGILIDRSGPPYVTPVDLRDCKEGDDAASLANYLSFTDHRLRSGQAVIGLHAGLLDQIRLRSDRYPDFHIRNIAASGVIWTGRGEQTEQYIPLNAVKDCHFDENPFSNVIRLSYGKFRYYSGGDIPGVADYTQPFWRDIETPVAAAVGPVDVMTLDHHGNRDSTNGAILRALRPRVIIEQNWLSAQPGEEVVVRMASHEFYPGPRDVFSTGMSPETRIAIGPIMDRIYKSYEGHVVVRVAPGGMTYEVFVLDDKDMQRKVIAYFGPYTAD